jgi:hypothetical protein
MIEHTAPQRGRPDPYCWICRGYGCDSPRQAIGDLSTWSPERVTLPAHADDEPWTWLNGPAAAWWYGHGSDVAA